MCVVCALCCVVLCCAVSLCEFTLPIEFLQVCLLCPRIDFVLDIVDLFAQCYVGYSQTTYFGTLWGTLCIGAKSFDIAGIPAVLVRSALLFLL